MYAGAQLYFQLLIVVFGSGIVKGTFISVVWFLTGTIILQQAKQMR